MTDFKETSCALCLKTITDKSFHVIDGVTRDILDALLLKLKFHGDSIEVICTVCRKKLNTASEFKSMCLNTEKIIISHVDCETMLQLDLRKIYIKENRSEHLTNISFSHKICRLCMQLINGELICIGDEELEAIHKFVPEMNVEIVKDPVICKPCFDFLCTHNTFLKDCLEVEQVISNTFKSFATESQTHISELFIKTENLENECEFNDMEIVKAECVDIKSEEEDGRDNLPLNSYYNAKEGLEDISKQNDSSVEKCNQSPSDSSLYKCETCEYATKKKKSLKRHTLRHKNPSEVQMYVCSDCNYKTKYKHGLTRHVLHHKSSSQVQMYKCDACNFETRYKDYIIKHQLLVHKDPSEVQMYRCSECDYKNKYKYRLTRHALLHKDPSQMLIYKCDLCDYESISKINLNQHKLIHKDPSEVQMYKCNDCNYETKVKNSLAQHVLQHKDSSQLLMYKCDACHFETKYKGSFITHQLIHKEPSEVQMYGCNDCDYKTRFKNSLVNHVLQHRDTSQVPVYKCDASNYETSFSGRMSVHQLTHKKLSEVKLYKCDTCSYQTKYKGNLKKHGMVHKTHL